MFLVKYDALKQAALQIITNEFGFFAKTLGLVCPYFLIRLCSPSLVIPKYAAASSKL